jgi:aryl-alcohol dehydrogenase-like predicted oxidoreductase
MGYGSPEWQPWVLGEEEAIRHIKFAYENGIQTFDTANAIQHPSRRPFTYRILQVYSNGLGEVVLGNAIKKLNLPREEIVVMTKVRFVAQQTG